MVNRFEHLISLFEKGGIDRRQLISALFVASTAPLAHASAPVAALQEGKRAAPVFRGRIINHVALHVRDVDRTRQFYEKLLGVKVMTDGGKDPKTPFYDFRLRDSFFGAIVNSTSGNPPGAIGHFAIGIDPWPGAERALAAVQKRFPESKPRTGENQWGKAVGQKNVTSVLLTDPDGIGVQIGHRHYQLK